MHNAPLDILTDVVEPTFLEQASSGKRLANYIIDRVVFTGLALGFGVMLGLFFPEKIYLLENINTVADILLTYVFYALYMAVLEFATKGRSIGKLITGTKAVNEDGSNISLGTAFIRSFCRFPIEQFSGLGNPCYPWHDQWSNTYVVDIKQSSAFNNNSQ